MKDTFLLLYGLPACAALWHSPHYKVIHRGKKIKIKKDITKDQNLSEIRKVFTLEVAFKINFPLTLK